MPTLYLTTPEARWWEEYLASMISDLDLPREVVHSDDGIDDMGFYHHRMLEQIRVDLPRPHPEILARLEQLDVAIRRAYRIKWSSIRESRVEERPLHLPATPAPVHVDPRPAVVATVEPESTPRASRPSQQELATRALNALLKFGWPTEQTRLEVANAIAATMATASLGEIIREALRRLELNYPEIAATVQRPWEHVVAVPRPRGRPRSATPASAPSVPDPVTPADEAEVERVLRADPVVPQEAPRRRGGRQKGTKNRPRTERWAARPADKRKKSVDAVALAEQAWRSYRETIGDKREWHDLGPEDRDRMIRLAMNMRARGRSKPPAQL